MVTIDGVTEMCRGEERLIRDDDPFDLVQQYLATAEMMATKNMPLPEIAVGIYRWAVIVDHKRCKVTLVSHDDPVTLLTWLTAVPTITILPFRLLSPCRNNVTRAEYGKKFYQIQQHLLAGDCYQVILSQRFSAYFAGDVWSAFCNFLDQNRMPFSVFIRIVYH